MIYIECKPDLALVKSLTKTTRRGIIQEFKGKGEICNRLRKGTNCKGLLDEDPESTQPRYLEGTKVESDLTEVDLRLLRDANNNHLIILCPRLEDWILKAAQEAGINIKQYNLPNNAVKLHQQININLDKFEKLLDDLKGSSGRMKVLKTLLIKRAVDR